MDHKYLLSATLHGILKAPMPLGQMGTCVVNMWPLIGRAVKDVAVDGLLEMLTERLMPPC